MSVIASLSLSFSQFYSLFFIFYFSPVHTVFGLILDMSIVQERRVARQSSIPSLHHVLIVRVLHVHQVGNIRFVAI